MCWIMTKKAYKGFTIVEQIDVQGADYGHMVTVDANRTTRDPVTGQLVREEWEFNTVQEAVDYIDDLLVECEARAESEVDFARRFTPLCAAYWY